MKILWVNPWFGNYRVPLYQQLKKLTDDNFYLIYGTNNMSSTLCDKLKNLLGEKSIAIDNTNSIVIGDPSSDLANSHIKIPRTKGVYKAIKRIQPDIIIVDGFFQWFPIALLYSKIHRVPIIIDYERTAFVERNSPQWRTAYRKIIGKFCTGFMVNGKLTVEYLNDLGFGKKPIVTGVMSADSFGLKKSVGSVSESEKNIIREKYNLKSGLTYLFVGQLVVRKGIQELLCAWKEHQKRYENDNLIVLGDGVLKENLIQYIKEHDLNVKILGQIPYEKIAGFYAYSDVMIMPTLEDNWSLVVPEGMAVGLPILCSVYNGGQCELVFDDVNGYSFDPLKEASIIKVLNQVHDADLKRMGEKSIEIESNFTPDKAAVRIYQFCMELLNPS